MVHLSNTQITAITSIAKPLAPPERSKFMAALLEELLHRREEIGDGSLARLLRELQSRYFEPPEPSGHEPGPRGWGRAGRT
jgi:hypothetical protein